MYIKTNYQKGIKLDNTYFGANNLVNNPEKAAILYNTEGKGSDIIFENIGEENIKSSESEKLLGLHINSDFLWHNQRCQKNVFEKAQTKIL